MARKRVRGARQTSKNLRDLGTLLGPPANESSRHALRPTLAEAKRNAPVGDTGLLKRSLFMKRVGREKLHPLHLIGPRNDVVGPDGQKPVKYAHLTEFGHVNRDGSFTPGSRWLTRAYETTKELAVRRFGERFGPALEKRAAKLAAKVRK